MKHALIAAIVMSVCAPGALFAQSASPVASPLHDAVAARDLDATRALLNARADVNAGDGAGRTPLHIAAQYGDEKLLMTLLAHGADVNAASAAGETPLHVAARHFKPAALRVLLAHGADVNAANATGRTPLDVLGSEARELDENFAALVGAMRDALLSQGARPGAAQPAELEPQPTPTPRGTADAWPLYSEIGPDLLAWENAYPNLCRRYSVGQSVQGRELWVLKISDNVDVEENEPEFRYIATLHGDEIVGTMLCMNLIEHMLTGYGTDPQVTNLIDEVEIWILPLANPDGYDRSPRTRSNAQGVDLNRNFPEGTNNDPNTTAGRAPETAALMNWSFGQSFVASANFHGGALVVNYPFDNDGLGSVFSPTPDEDMFVYVSETYSWLNQPMWNGSFYHGITNGAAWYSIDGGHQDWNYRYMGCNDLTIELSNIKQPAPSTIPTYWENNRDAMLAYMETCLIGVRGIVTDADNGAPLAATVTVVGRDHPIYTDPDVGDYHRMLLPGTYDILFEADGYDPVTLPVTVSSGPATVLDVQLGPSARVTYPNGGEQLDLNAPVTVTWVGNPTAQFEVEVAYNYGQNNSVSDGFETGALGPEYTLGGNVNWYVTPMVQHTGSYGARAGNISHNQVSWMTRTVSGGEVSFWYKVSSESGYDFFNFYVNGIRELQASGNGVWQEYATVLPPGQHELKWEYDKDYSVSNYNDTVYLDDLLIVDDQTQWQLVATTPGGATSTSWTPTQLSDSAKVRVRAWYGGTSFGDWDESDAVFEVVDGGGPALGDLNCDGSINAGDIDPFVLALTDPAAYAAAYPTCDRLAADCNQDGVVNAGDIDPFVTIIVNP